MTNRAVPLLTLSLITLLSTTSIASAGFVWLSPDDKTSTRTIPYTAAGEPVEAQARSDGRNWKVEESAPVALAPAPVVVSSQGMDAASAQIQTILAPDTMASQPVVGRGEVAVAPVAISAPVASEPAPVVLAASSTLPTAEGRVALYTPPAASGMPSAQALIDSMPSMTAPRREVPVAQAPVIAAPAPVAVAQVAPANTAPVVLTGAAVSPITGATLAPETVPVNNSALVQGFGKQVPLAVAVRQLLPRGYTLVRGDGVDLSRSVDWQGGKVWSEVLTDAVRPLGLGATVSGDTVVLARQDAPAALTSSVVVPVAVGGARPVLGNTTMMGTPVNN